MIELSIQSNIADVEVELRRLGLYIPGISRKILKRLTSKGKSKLQKAYKSSGLKQNTGRLYKGIFGSAKSDVVAYLGVLSKQAYKFVPQNYGKKMVAKDDYMRFQINGNWVAVKEFTIKERDYFKAAENYINSGEADRDTEIVLQKEIDKMEKLI